EVRGLAKVSYHRQAPYRPQLRAGNGRVLVGGGGTVRGRQLGSLEQVGKGGLPALLLIPAQVFFGASGGKPPFLTCSTCSLECSGPQSQNCRPYIHDLVIECQP